MGAVERFCDRAMLLERGARRARSASRAQVGAQLPGAELRAQASAQPTTQDEERVGDRRAEIVDAWFEDDDGERTDVLAPGRDVHVRIARALQRGDRATRSSRFLIENDRHHPLFAISNEDGDTRDRHATRPATRRRSRVSFENVLAPGRIYVTPWVAARAAARRSSTAASGFATAVVAARARLRRRRRPAGDDALRARRAGDGMSAPAATPITGPVGARRRARAGSRTSRVTLAVTDFKLRFFGSALGYLWQLDAPAAAVRRALRRVHALRPDRRRRELLRRRAARQHRAVHVLRRGDGRRASARSSTARTCAQDPVPAAASRSRWC